MPIPLLILRSLVTKAIGSVGGGGSAASKQGLVQGLQQISAACDAVAKAGEGLRGARIGMQVDVRGDKEVQAFLKKLQEGARAAEDTTVLVGSGLHYARYQEFGTRRGLRGRHYLTNALRRVESRIGPELAAALPQGPAAVNAALLRLAYEVQAEAQRTAPVKTGSLRRSLHTVQSPRGGGLRARVG